MNKKILSVLAYIVAALSLVYLYVSGHLFARFWLFIAVQVAAALLMIWARLTFGIRSFHAAANTSKGALITNGPYRYWRHPIYASVIYFIWAGQFHSPTILSILAALIITAAMGSRMLLEEQFLFKTYPEYKEYAKRTKRIIPFIS
ncbi:MAG TPA: methyltransferase [Balneolales bacterium]|nr:methyltransferase [Balneolales bacterium]